jgi:hypothetical protein
LIVLAVELEVCLHNGKIESEELRDLKTWGEISQKFKKQDCLSHYQFFIIPTFGDHECVQKPAQ